MGKFDIKTTDTVISKKKRGQGERGEGEFGGEEK